AALQTALEAPVEGVLERERGEHPVALARNVEPLGPRVAGRRAGREHQEPEDDGDRTHAGNECSRGATGGPERRVDLTPSIPLSHRTPLPRERGRHTTVGPRRRGP